MHMADALISPTVGGTMWAVSGGLIAFCARKVQQSLRENLTPMMGVLGAFVFAAQMINFSIPGTGSSGHLGGGLLLAILLGPHAAFLVIASVLTVQALFFADGGLLALGCNIFNLGFYPTFIAYPLVYRRIVGNRYTGTRALVAALTAALIALELGAFSVVVQTRMSGISDLPFSTFIILMLPVHAAIGVVEGLATAAVIAFVARMRPDALMTARECPSALRSVLVAFVIAALVTGGIASWFASAYPDGLEWSLAKATGKEELALPDSAVHRLLAKLQEKVAFFPDYEFKRAAEKKPADETATESAPQWPAVSVGTTVSGIVGGLITLAVAALIGIVLKAWSTKCTKTL